MMLIVSLIGGGAFAVKTRSPRLPTPKNGVLSLYIRRYRRRRIGILPWDVNADAL